MSIASLLDILYAQVDQIWGLPDLSVTNTDRLYSLVVQIRNLSGIIDMPLRPSLPKSIKPEGLSEEHASKKKRSLYTIDPDMDLDQLAERMETVAKDQKIASYYDCEAPEGQPVLKCSLAHTKVCIANVEGNFIPSWQIVGTKETTKRMTEGLPLVICKRIHRTIQDMQSCTFAHTLDKLQTLIEGRTAADVARQSAHLPQPESPKPIVVSDTPLTYTTTKGEQKTVTIDKVVQNQFAIEAMRDGRGRQCAKVEPHNAVGCSFVHPIGSPTTTLMVSGVYYKASDLEKNVARANLLHGLYKSGTKCIRPEEHDVALCAFIHVKEGAVPAIKPADQSSSTTTLAEAESSRERKNREAEAAVSAVKEE